jgi:hypothetical protein
VATVSLGRTAGLMEVDVEAPRAVTLISPRGLAVQVGETWTVQISLRGQSTTHSTMVVSGDTRASIAGRLASLINAEAADVFTATSDADADGMLVVVNRDGAPFKVTLAVPGETIGVETIDRSTPLETALNLSGTPVAGEVWKVILGDGATTPTVHSFLVGGGASLQTIAAGLAAVINTGADADYTAVAEGGVLLIVRRDGTAFSATPQIVAAGQPARNEQWTVTLTSATFPTTTFTVVPELDTIDISLVTGQFVNPAGKVTRPGAPNDTGGITVSAASASATLTRTPLAGETWTIDLNGIDFASVTYGEIVNSVEVTTLEEFVAALAFKINALAGFDAAVRPVTGDSLAEVARKLADRINVLGLPEFRATSEGDLLHREHRRQRLHPRRSR